MVEMAVNIQKRVPSERSGTGALLLLRLRLTLDRRVVAAAALAQEQDDDQHRDHAGDGRPEEHRAQVAVG